MKKIINKLLKQEEKKLPLQQIALFLEQRDIDIMEMDDVMAWLILPKQSRGLFVKTRDINSVAKIEKFLEEEL